MITCCLLTNLLSCFLFYNTSKKATLNQDYLIEKWVQKNTLYTKLLGIFLNLISLIIAIIHFGITAGSLFYIFTFTSFLSLLIVLYPLKKINYKHITVISLLIILLEFIYAS